jgi:outer membrane murein-binding lipoprotein Lpp
MPILRGRSVAAAGLGVTAVLVLAGCSSEPDYCSQVTTTQEAYDELAATDVLAEGTDTLSARYDAFSAEVDQLLGSAQTEFADESDAVRAAVDQFGGVVESAAELNLGEAAQQLEPALSSLQSATTSLFTSVTQACE